MIAAAPTSTPASVLAASRLREIETLRGIAIGAVVMIHTAWDYAVAAGMERPAGKAAVALHLTSSFAVPLFIMLSSVGLSLGYGTQMSAGGYANFLRRRALRLLPAYVFWSVISIAAFKPQAFGSPSNFVRILLHGKADAQYYFIPLIFELYVLWPVFQPLARASARSATAGFVVAVSAVSFSAWWWQFTVWKPHLQGTKFMILVCILYVGLGIAAAPRLALLKKLSSQGVIVAAAVCLTAATAWIRYESFIANAEKCSFQPPGVYWASIIFTLPATAFIVCAASLAALLVFRHTDTLGRVFMLLGHHAYGVFLIHYLALRLLVYRVLEPTALATASTANVVATIILGWMAAIVISTAVVAAASRFPPTRPLVDHRW